MSALKDILVRPNIKYWFLISFPKIFLIIICFISERFISQLPNIGHYMRVGLGVVVLILLVMAFWDLMIIKNTRYIIKAEQIVILTGVFVKTTNYIEMYRIFDYSRVQNIGEALLSLMTVKILSRDPSHPLLSMKGIPNDISLVQTIRDRVELQKTIKGVREINY
ncbi:PH domain-containing protein [Parabacteroides sp. PF5-9]|uniref:PH domain-containing protein n=1 Tax=Parabacteroides sp. PF5-9 TaxID=1742404 RepID=UPI00247450D8|nr:PH domain-containing protein [Parabacteroides sp. PF5-9]MDH6358969.1 hypothetical protein [Parabacteroides sp. PF5-9]